MEARTNMIANLEAEIGWSIATLQEHSPDSHSSQASMRPTGAEASEPSTNDDDALEWEVETDEPHSSEETHRHIEKEIEICHHMDDGVEARRLTDGVHPSEDYHCRQHAAHAIATTMGSGNDAATSLANAFFASSGVVRSLLHLAYDAEAHHDPLTGDIVLACLTNMSGEVSGSGITLIMQEAEAVSGMLVRVLAEGHASSSSTNFATACLCNLRSQPAVVGALEASPVAAMRLRELSRTAHGETAGYARALVAVLQARARASRAVRPASAAMRRNPSSGSLLPSLRSSGGGEGGMLGKTVRRVASFGRVRSKQLAPVLYSDLSIGLLSTTNDLSAV